MSPGFRLTALIHVTIGKLMKLFDYGYIVGTYLLGVFIGLYDIYSDTTILKMIK